MYKVIKPEKCDICNGKIYYLEKGQYICKACGHILEDDFAKIRNYLQNNNENLVQTLTEEIGVDSGSIEYLLHKVVTELLEDDSDGLKCERCGCSIIEGRFCSSCKKELAGGIRAMLYESGSRKIY